MKHMDERGNSTMTVETKGSTGMNRRVLLGRVAATAAAAFGVAWGASQKTGAGRSTASSSMAHGHHQHKKLDRSGFRYAQGDPGYGARRKAKQGQIVRKSASSMSSIEIDRFTRAFRWAVAKGYLDVFNDEHFDHMRNRQHGADVLSSTPPEAAAGLAPSWGFRLLPWHRSFLIETEAMLRAALHDRNLQEGGDLEEADLVFLPYWDAAHLQDLPLWVRQFIPRGGTAIVPEGIPPGHAAFGKPVGSRYDIELNRWPGSYLVFDRLPPVEQLSRALAHDEWVDFYNAIDNNLEVVTENVEQAKRGLAGLALKIPSDPNLQLILEALNPSYPKDPASQLAVFNAFLAVGFLASVEEAKLFPDVVLIKLIKDVYSAFRFQPHLLLHFWAGGLNPNNPNIRGTVSYFNELIVDPVFLMLHGELDRIWYTWETTHSGIPTLTGDDAVFQPLLPEEGGWYGGGKTYQLAELVNHDGLPYTYDALFTD